LLWIKGDPGKGKTMLLCGIINKLNNSITQRALLSYSFCQATDSRSVPTVIATGSLKDEVRGFFLIFGMHPSQADSNRRYQSENEHDEHVIVEVEVLDGETQKVEATVRVWNDDVKGLLKPYKRRMDAKYLVEAEWYNIVPNVVLKEDEALRSIPPIE
jgi:protocatechuate 3,4-dioxygenase beta subunit